MHMRLPEIDDLPVILTGHGIGVALAQKANLIGVDQLVDRRGIGPEFLVVELDGPFVLLAAMNQLQFLVTLDRLRNLRCGDGEGNQDERHQEEHRNEHESRFGIGAAVSLWRKLHFVTRF